MECAGRAKVWQMGKLIPDEASNDKAGWAWPRNGLASRGFDPANPEATLGPCGVNCTNFSEIYAFHPGGANVLFADGSVHMLAPATPYYIVAALRTRAGGEVLPAGSW